MQRKMYAGAEQLLFQKADRLRRKQTIAEEILWNYLRTRPYNYKFRRQHPFADFVLDFYCQALQLVIEVGGLIHEQEEVKKNDAQRQKILEEYGLTVLRFSNEQVAEKLEEVIQLIDQFVQQKDRQYE